MMKTQYQKFAAIILKKQCDLQEDQLAILILENMKCLHKLYSKVGDLELISGKIL